MHPWYGDFELILAKIEEQIIMFKDFNFSFLTVYFYTIEIYEYGF